MQVRPKQVPFLGVTIGIMTILGLAQMLVPPPRAARASAEESVTVATLSQDEVIARYAQVQNLLQERRDPEALSLLADIADEPIVLGHDSNEEGPIGGATPAVCLFQLGYTFLDRADAAANEGKTGTARCWVSRCRELGKRVGRNGALTPISLSVAERLERMAARANERLGY